MVYPGTFGGTPQEFLASAVAALSPDHTGDYCCRIRRLSPNSATVVASVVRALRIQWLQWSNSHYALQSVKC